jgi:prepilin peptidase CpaA
MEAYFAWGAVSLAIVAAAYDIRTRRIPNTLTYGGIVSGVVLRTLMEGWHGMGQALLGGVMAGGAFLLFFLVKGLGAGDVKLMAAIGSWVGFAQSVVVLIATAMAGGVLAVGYMIYHRRGAQTLRNIVLLTRFHGRSGIRPHPEINLNSSDCIRIPYAVAIAIGTFYAFSLMQLGG